MKQLQLTPSEQAWLAAYRLGLCEAFPGLVEHILIYGSKARGDAGPDSDLDVLLIVRNDAKAQMRELRRLGYLLAVGTDAVPSILAYTVRQWEARRKSGSPFRRAVERDEVHAL